MKKTNESLQDIIDKLRKTYNKEKINEDELKNLYPQTMEAPLISLGFIGNFLIYAKDGIILLPYKAEPIERRRRLELGDVKRNYDKVVQISYINKLSQDHINSIQRITYKNLNLSEEQKKGLEFILEKQKLRFLFKGEKYEKN